MATAKNSKKGKRPFKSPARKVRVWSAKTKDNVLLVSFSERASETAKGGIKAGPPSGRPNVQVVESKKVYNFECASADHAKLLADHALRLNASNSKAGLVYQIKSLASDENKLSAARERAKKMKIRRAKESEQKEQDRMRRAARAAAMAEKNAHH